MILRKADECTNRQVKLGYHKVSLLKATVKIKTVC